MLSLIVKLGLVNCSNSARSDKWHYITVVGDSYQAFWFDSLNIVVERSCSLENIYFD